MGRRQPRGLETREKILAAALDEFAERGYAVVTIEDIAQRAGTTKGAVYYWFADKDDLGRDLQHGLYERLMMQALHALDPDGDLVTNMRRAFEVYLGAVGDLGQARFFLRDAWTIPALDEGGRKDQQDAVALVRDLLVTGVGRGEVVALDPDSLARVLLGAWAEATLHVLTTGERAPAIAVVDHLVESLRTKPETPPDAAPDPRSRRGAAVRAPRRRS